MLFVSPQTAPVRLVPDRYRSSITTKFLRGDSTWQEVVGANATHTGDATGATALTLATVNSNVGSFGSATQASQVTVNAKGLVTAAANVTVTPAVGSITGLGTGVATALAINTGSAGAPVVNGGPLGTPSAGTLTNCGGLPATALTGTLPVARLAFTKAELNAAVSNGDVLFVGDVSGAAVTVRDIDGTPSIAATTLEFTNGTVTDQGSGIARITISGGGGGLAEPLVMPSTAMAALAIDVSKYVNTKSISGNVTMTFSNNTPTAGTRTEVRITADATARTVTIPSAYSYTRNAHITSVVVPANATTSLSFEYTGSRWEVYGDPVVVSGSVGSYLLVDVTTPPGDGQTIKWASGTSKWVPADDLNSGGGGGGTGDMLSVLTAAEIALTTTATLTISRMHVCSGSSDYTVTLPPVSGNTGKFVGIRIAASATAFVTIDGNLSETIDGDLTKLMRAKEAAVLYCDGTAWVKMAGKTIAARARAGQTGTVGAGQSIPHEEVTTVTLDTTDYDNASMVNLSTEQITIKRAGYYGIIAQLTYNSLPATGTNIQVRVHKNGTSIANSSVYSTTGSYPVTALATTALLAAGDVITLRAFHTNGLTTSLFRDTNTGPIFIELTEQIGW